MIKTGLPDLHKVTVTVLKRYFKKFEPEKFIYCDTKNFSNQKFGTELVKEMSENNVVASQFELF